MTKSCGVVGNMCPSCPFALVCTIFISQIICWNRLLFQYMNGIPTLMWHSLRQWCCQNICKIGVGFDNYNTRYYGLRTYHWTNNVHPAHRSLAQSKLRLCSPGVVQRLLLAHSVALYLHKADRSALRLTPGSQTTGFLIIRVTAWHGI